MVWGAAATKRSAARSLARKDRDNNRDEPFITNQTDGQTRKRALFNKLREVYTKK
jgi:hypothetical protein